MSRIDVTIDLCDVETEVLEAVSLGTLVSELKGRGMKVVDDEEKGGETDIKEMIKKIICDKLGLNYLTSDSVIFKEISRIFNE